MEESRQQLDTVQQKLNWIEIKVDELLRNQRLIMNAMLSIARSTGIEIDDYAEKMNEPVTLQKGRVHRMVVKPEV
ncbi:MAG: hypothetical protein M0P69_05440 [Bacteroidales bacterium]|nr:hypothetical protein [Bacteroidales bacterium]